MVVFIGTVESTHLVIRDLNNDKIHMNRMPDKKKNQNTSSPNQNSSIMIALYCVSGQACMPSLKKYNMPGKPNKKKALQNPITRAYDYTL